MKALILLAPLMMALCACSRQPTATQPPGPPKVQVLQIQPQRVEVFDEIPATLTGSANTEVRAQVTGYLLRQHYKDGAAIQEGDLLFEIDPQPFQTAVLKAQADVESALAEQVRTEQQEMRNRELIQANAVSRQELEASIMANSAAKARVRALDAILERARLDLAFTRITAPISGIAGPALPGRGDLITPTQTLTTISTLNPIKARFSISETIYLKYAPKITAAAARSDDQQPELFELIRADGTLHPHRGRLDFVDREVQATTGSLAISTIFPNPDLILRPGQFARVRITAAALPEALAVPQRAVMEMQGRHLLVVIGENNMAEFRPVRTGPRSGHLWVIEEGLRPGETIVVEGLLKCRPGQPVQPEPWSPPAS